jgi:hypothetical protein
VREPSRAARKAVLRHVVERTIRASATADPAEMTRLGRALRAALARLDELEGKGRVHSRARP